MKKDRLLYIDNVKLFLTALVVVHHLSLTYGAIGSWYYVETKADSISTMLLTMFTASNQSFFMGHFFLISAYFTAASFDRKSIKNFTKGKLMRLAIPILVYYLVISSSTNWLMLHYLEGSTISLWEYIVGINGELGPMWFVLALLMFSGGYAIFRMIWKNVQWDQESSSRIKTLHILMIAFLLGCTSFIVRLWFPVGWTWQPFNFQLAHFTQYIFLFVAGIVIYHKSCLNIFSYEKGIGWFLFAQLLIFIGFPLIFYLGGAYEGQISQFLGGRTWQSFIYSIWEQVVGLSLIMGLMGLFSKYFMTQGPLAKKLSSLAYTVYIIHPFVLVGLCLIFRNVDIYPLLKFAIMAPVVLLACFGLAGLIVRLPYAKKVL